MNKREFNKFSQVWRMMYSNQPMTDEILEFICEQSNMTIKKAKTVLDLRLGLWELSADKLIELDL